jgi:signal transduction histidine kinase
MLQEATVPLPDGNVLLTYLDVTDTARVERALRERNEALETAGRLKSEFIANVSYELRTPLNAVIGFAEILTNQYFGDLNPRQLEYSRGILASSHQLLKLINDILDLATIEAGYMTLETARVEVFEMLQAVLTLTRERARSRDLDLQLHCPRNIGAIDVDERRVKQALFNLVSNAIKFTPPGGAISIEAERGEGELLLIVADTGVGIPRTDQARVFEKFERGARQSGAGLGLSLVKSLIELHGGAVTIDSTPGRGTKIICRLPMAQRGIGSFARPPQFVQRIGDPSGKISASVRSAGNRKNQATTPAIPVALAACQISDASSGARLRSSARSRLAALKSSSAAVVARASATDYPLGARRS